MDTFEKYLKEYFNLPYRPEFLYKKIREELKYYNFTIIKQSNYKIINKTYNALFAKIFGEQKEIYEFNHNVTEALSIDNFKNLVYETCTFYINKINKKYKKDILAYLFFLDEFKETIIKIIYFSTSEKFAYNFYDKIFNVILYEQTLNISRDFFDSKNMNNFINKNLNKYGKHNFYLTQFNLDDDDFNLKNIKINYLKFEYFGPDETKYNFILNKTNKGNTVTLFSPDFLIKSKKNQKTEYNNDDFQIFNLNNNCPGLFRYMLKEAIIQMNKKIKGEEMNNNIVDNIGIIYFDDNTVGLYLNMINNSLYYEQEKLKKELNPNTEKNDLHIVFSASETKVSKTRKEGESLTNQQQFFAEYNSHVQEEQLSTTIINTIGHEMLNTGMERLPRIIFYFNLYILKTIDEKERISFSHRQKEYGFEEADGIFFLKDEDVVLNSEGNIPFLKIKRFNLFNYDILDEKEEDNKILINKNSLIYMEVKNSFPIKFELDSNKIKTIKGLKEAESLIKNILRRSKKFYEIALNLGKNIDKVHILLLYDSVLQPTDDIEEIIFEFHKILKELKLFGLKNYIFDIVYFVNSASINMRKLSNIVINLREKNTKLELENQKLKENIEELYKKIDSISKQIKNNNKINLNNKAEENINNINVYYDDGDINSINIFEKINNLLKQSIEKVIDIKYLKDGIIFLISQKHTYIIKNNIIKYILEGYRNIILSLNNGDILTTYGKKIFLYKDETFLNLKEIDINNELKQIIELKYDNKLLILSKDSKIMLIEIDEQNVKKEVILEYGNEISLIIEINNNGEFIIIFSDGNLVIYNLKLKKEIKHLVLKTKNIIESVNAFMIFNKHLYICSVEALFIIDIEKKELNQVNFRIEKIYKFNDDIYGIHKNTIYSIIINEKEIKKKVLCHNTSSIYSLCLIKENLLIYSTENGVNFFNIN